MAPTPPALSSGAETTEDILDMLFQYDLAHGSPDLDLDLGSSMGAEKKPAAPIVETTAAPFASVSGPDDIVGVDCPLQATDGEVVEKEAVTCAENLPFCPLPHASSLPPTPSRTSNRPAPAAPRIGSCLQIDDGAPDEPTAHDGDPGHDLQSCFESLVPGLPLLPDGPMMLPEDGNGGDGPFGLDFDLSVYDPLNDVPLRARRSSNGGRGVISGFPGLSDRISTAHGEVGQGYMCSSGQGVIFGNKATSQGCITAAPLASSALGPASSALEHQQMINHHLTAGAEEAMNRCTAALLFQEQQRGQMWLQNTLCLQQQGGFTGLPAGLSADGSRRPSFSSREHTALGHHNHGLMATTGQHFGLGQQDVAHGTSAPHDRLPLARVSTNSSDLVQRKAAGLGDDVGESRGNSGQ
jgi:hypothetical protein